jgi:putative glycosyltransferase (TIGR04372 family)
MVVPRLFVIPFLIIINETNFMKDHEAFLNPEGNFEGELNNLIHRYDSPLSLSEDAVVGFLNELPDDFRKSSEKVVLALRDSTYTEKVIGADSNYSSIRDMNENQIEMIVNTLTFNGCKVIRGGSASKPLSKIRNLNFYDYSNSSLRNDFNDLALFATSKFCIGADTGLHNLALLMRKPTYLLSTASFMNKLTSPLVKLIAYCDFVDTKTNNSLSLYEMKERGVFNMTGGSDFFEAGVTVRKMDEKSIFEFICEVLKFERGEWEASSYSIELKRKFLEYLKPHGFKMDSTFNFPNLWARTSKWLD